MTPVHARAQPKREWGMGDWGGKRDLQGVGIDVLRRDWFPLQGGVPR